MYTIVEHLLSPMTRVLVPVLLGRSYIKDWNLLLQAIAQLHAAGGSSPSLGCSAVSERR